MYSKLEQKLSEENSNLNIHVFVRYFNTLEPHSLLRIGAKLEENWLKSHVNNWSDTINHFG
jgi:hypothetical protein